MLRIEQQWGRIGLEISPFRLFFKKTEPEIKLVQEMPSVDIHFEKPLIAIDQQRCWEEIGYYRPLVAARHWTADSRQEAVEAIAKKAREGDRLAAIQNGESIADIAKENSISFCDFNLTAIPRSRPKIETVDNPVRVKTETGKVNLELKSGEVKTHFVYGQVTGRWLVKPEIKIDFLI